MRRRCVCTGSLGYLSIASNNSRHSLVNGGRFTRELEEVVDIARILLSEANRGLDGGSVFRHADHCSL